MLGVFANDLTMHLTFRGHVDNNVVEQFRVTTQPPTLRQWAFPLIKFNFGCNERRQMFRTRGHLMLLESARHAGDLAATAKSTATADRVNIYAKRSGGFEQAGVFWKLATLSRW